MTLRQHSKPSAFVLCTAALLIVGWLVAGPAGYGGSTTWVVPHGTSMAPTLDSADLVVLKPAAGYEVGDVIGYRSRALHTSVLHRIVDRDGDRFRTRGDANAWRDPDRVAADQILGTVWFHVPGGGRVLETLRTPWADNALIATTLLVLGRAGRRRRPGGARRATQPSQAARRAWWPSTVALGQGALVTAAVAVALALMSFAPPTATDTPDEQTYAHHAQLRYTAPAPVSGIYDQDRLRTGDPIFYDVTPVVRAELRLLPSSQADHVAGTVRPLLQLQAGNGWQRSMPLGPASTVNGRHSIVSTNLNLATADRLVRTAEQRSGVSLGGYTVTVAFQTSLRGTVDGHRFHDMFVPRLSFTADGRQAILAGGAKDGSAVTFSDEGSIPGHAGVAAPVRVLGWQIAPEKLRIVAGVLAVLTGVLTVWWRRRRHPSPSPAALFGRRLVPATAVNLTDRAVVDVDALATLERLATQHDLPVIWQRTAHGACYHVDLAGTVYRHRLIGTASQQQVLG